jgi:ribonuclease HIII
MNLKTYIDKLKLKSAELGFVFSEKEIKYGSQLLFEKDSEKIPINIYYSVKKGITTVVGGSKNNVLRPEILTLLEKPADKADEQHTWNVWAGTDESGKGDYFGPLVVCGFIANKKIEPILKKLGVQDSKKITDKDIKRIAEKLLFTFPKSFEVLILNPVKYNDLYEKFRSQGKKLNEMLAWMHARIILNLKQKHSFEGAVVDKFANDKTMKTSLKGIDEVQLIQKHQAESDIAVAAASIIARYFFLKNLRKLGDEFGIDLPKGASAKVITVGKQLTEHKISLGNVAKLHFKTTEKIRK